MGCSSIIKDLHSPLTVKLSELLAVQTLVTKGRSRAEKRFLGAPLSLSKIRGRGMDFAETRNYFPGDDIRYMDWRVTARTNKPHVKVFQVERERPVIILSDFSPTMFFGTQYCLKSVLSAKFAALLAWTASAHGDRVGGRLLAPGHQRLWLPQARNQTLVHFLKALAAGTAAYEHPLWKDATAEQTLARMVKALLELQLSLKPGSLIVILSDWYYPLEELRAHFLKLNQHHSLILYQIADPFELGPLGKGLFPISNGQQILPLNLYDPKAFDAYQSYCSQRQAKLQAWVKKMGINYYLVTATTDLLRLTQQSLLRGLGG